jgi:gamma-glutamyltranspeptidase/glutathione hydrolase
VTPLALAAPNEAAADAGEDVARAGGSAVDATVAAALVAMVNEIGVVSLDSGGFVTVQPSTGPAYTVDGWMDMPGRDHDADPSATWDVHTEYGGGVDITIGPGSVAVGGSLPALGEAHQRDGRLPWRDVVAPAVEVARHGFRVGRAARYYMEYVHESMFGWDDASRAVLHEPGGELTTDLIVMPDLVRTLQTIADAGPRALHDGDLAEAISRDVTDRGGLMGTADRSAYRPAVTPSLEARLGPWTLSTTVPPSVGGVCVAAMLRLLDGWRPDDVDRMVEVQRRVLGHRLAVLDHTDDLETDARAFLRGLESPSTAHVSAVDGDGVACAATISSGYGSGMIARGTGIWLNNCLGEQELNPQGLHGTPPGVRLLSNMAPTVGRRDDGSVLAVGSPGAERITTAIVQVLTCFVAGMTLQEAVHHARVHVQHAGRPDEQVRREDEPTMYFGGVGAALVEAGGHLVAAGDPRRDGAVRIVR